MHDLPHVVAIADRPTNRRPVQRFEQADRSGRERRRQRSAARHAPRTETRLRPSIAVSSCDNAAWTCGLLVFCAYRSAAVVAAAIGFVSVSGNRPRGSRSTVVRPRVQW